MKQRPNLIPPAVAARARPAGRVSVAFGRRFFLLLFVGLVWLGPAWWEPRFFYGMLAWDVLVLGLWAVDLRRLPPAERLELRRSWSAPVGLSTPATVELELRNRSSVALQVTAVDDVPPQLRRSPPVVELAARPGGAGRASYNIEPAERGDAAVGEVFLRYQSALQVAERWARAPLRQTVRVYPNLEESKRQTIYLIRSRQIELEKRLKRQRGQGREFESLREYRDGDEWRDVCWTATARRAKLITKVYQIERSQTVWLVLDAGRLLRARVRPRSAEEKTLGKLDYAVNAALSLAQVALHSGDRVGLLAYGRRIQQRLAPGRGAAHLRAAIEQLALVRGEAWEAGHLRAAQALLAGQKRRSLVVWITDLSETATTPEVIEGASRMTPRHLVVFVALRQPELHELAARRPADEREMYRCVAAREMLERRELLLRGLRQRGAHALEIEPGLLATTLVNQYLEVKQRSRL